MDTIGKYHCESSKIKETKFRQQLHSDDSLASLLGFKEEKYKNYDVYVYELMEGTISEKDENGLKEMIDEANLKSLILQLIEGLDQLENADLSHNDINPKSILYKSFVLQNRIRR